MSAHLGEDYKPMDKKGSQMITKADLQKKVEELENELAAERNRPTGHRIENCNIDMNRPDETKLAVAQAVKEGMKALQSLGGDSYGIYFSSPNGD
jgi:hypothetical protein